MQLSDGEKLIITMLADLIKHSDTETELDPDFIREAIFTGHYWALRWKYSGIYSDAEPNPPKVSEVVKILNMWDLIERAYDKLTKDEKRELAEAVPLFGSNPQFQGFDGNNETEYMSIAMMLTGPLGLWRRFTDRDLNAHMPTVESYLRAYSTFEPMLRALGDRDLNKEELSAILRSMRHPDAPASD